MENDISGMATIPSGEPLGTYVQRIRTLRGLSRLECAQRAGINISSMIRIETGKTGTTRPRRGVQERLSAVLQIPVEYLQAAARQEPFRSPPLTKVCLSCWVAGTLPDARWSMVDAKFCLRCGDRLLSECPSCTEPLFLKGRFCPGCGSAYQRRTASSNG